MVGGLDGSNKVSLEGNYSTSHIILCRQAEDEKKKCQWNVRK